MLVLSSNLVGGSTGTVALGNSGYNEYNPEIAGKQVTWQAWDGNDWKVYAADISVDASL
ncbi:MAG: hypothetical protein AAGE96_11000 [Cyanobacteria bacterium P01_G01_bin.19]